MVKTLRMARDAIDPSVPSISTLPYLRLLLCGAWRFKCVCAVSSYLSSSVYLLFPQLSSVFLLTHSPSPYAQVPRSGE